MNYIWSEWRNVFYKQLNHITSGKVMLLSIDPIELKLKLENEYTDVSDNNILTLYLVIELRFD